MISQSDLSALESHFECWKDETAVTIASMRVEQAPSRTSTNSKLPIDESQNEETQSLSANNVTWLFLAAFGCLCVVNLVCAIDATILSVALPTIATALHGSAIEAFWSGTSYLLTSTVFQPTWASLSHVVGRKPILLLALSFFSIGTIVASVSKNFAVLIGGRCVQGVGGGGIVALTYVIVTDMVTLRQRGKWYGLISLQWAIGAASGPCISGAFAQKSTWRWIFWMNISFCIVAFVGIPIFLRLNHKAGGILEQLKKFDWVGSVIFVASLTSLLIPLTWGGVEYSWSSWHTLVPLLLGILGLIAFMGWSKYLAPEALIRGSIFAHSTSKVGYFGTTAHGIMVYSLLYYMPLYFQVGRQFSPISSGLGVFPMTLTIGPAGIVVGLIITKTGKYRSCVLVGWFLSTVGMGLLVLLKSSTATAGWIFLSLVGGMGIGILYSAQSLAVQACASNADLPFAAAMYSFFHSLGQTFGVAVGGVVFQNTLKHKLLVSVNPYLVTNAAEFAKDSSALVLIVKEMEDGELKSELVKAYVDSVRVVWIAMCAFAAVAFVLSWVWIRDVSLDRIIETDQGFRHGEKRLSAMRGGTGISDPEKGGKAASS